MTMVSIDAAELQRLQRMVGEFDRMVGTAPDLYFRIGADKHWASDVTVGWITGAAIGFAVPYFLHRGAPPVTPTVSRTSTTTTLGVAASW